MGKAVPPKTTIVIATHNQGKLEEIKQLLRGFPVSVKPLTEIGPIPPIEEDGRTFEENAYKKASFCARILGVPALADDSGLKVTALDGRPGVLSARYAGQGATDRQRCSKLLAELHGAENREAVFECVISIAVPSGKALSYTAECRGLIGKKPVGVNGFGYDPIFFYPPLQKTFAEMSKQEKNRVSHRGRALREVAAEFSKILRWIDNHMPGDHQTA